ALYFCNNPIIRWLVRLAHDRRLFTACQYMYVSELLTECGRMVGGWLKKSSHKRQSDAPGKESV
ncbi:hypothetical protein J7L67_07725, partial [bacterium]|nr:hypothetical protein [bacterium]